MENLIKMDDLGVPLFLETPKCSTFFLGVFISQRMMVWGVLHHLRKAPFSESDWISREYEMGIPMCIISNMEIEVDSAFLLVYHS